jgi:hypothetical protein
MRKFWFLLWFNWAIWVSISSVLIAGVFDFFITFGLYIYKGMPELNSDTLNALTDIWLFWFSIIWSMALLLSIFLSVKRLFNRCYTNSKLQLLTCNEQELIDIVLLGDIVKVWRKWLMVIIWFVAIEILVFSVLRYILGFGMEFWEWFSMYWLYIFILFAAFLSLPLMVARCRRIRLVSC